MLGLPNIGFAEVVALEWCQTFLAGMLCCTDRPENLGVPDEASGPITKVIHTLLV
jgi:hypothetical protein